MFNIRTRFDSRTYGGLIPGSSVPIYQAFPRNPEKGGIYNRLLTFMIDLAHRGEIMIELPKFMDMFRDVETMTYE